MSTKKVRPIKPSLLKYSLFGNIIVNEETDRKKISKHDSFLKGDDFFFSAKKANTVNSFVESSIKESPSPKSNLRSNSPEEEVLRKSSQGSQNERAAMVDKLIQLYDKSFR